MGARPMKPFNSKFQIEYSKFRHANLGSTVKSDNCSTRLS